MDLVEVRVVFENLMVKRVLDRDQTRYRFTMDLLRHWVQVEHNVWEVLGAQKRRSAEPLPHSLS